MPKKSFGGSTERDIALDRYEDGMRDLMRKAACKALKAKGIDHYVRRGEIVIKKQHLENELWEHRFSFDSYSNHI